MKMDAPGGRVFIIAGSDSGGGAGIQADIKTVTALGGFASTAITAITAQNTLGVHDIWPVPIAAVEAQIRVVLSDIGADAIKIGMLGTRDLIEVVAEALSEIADHCPRIVDPVMVATSGDPLLERGAVDVLKQTLVPGAALVTPNAPEAEILTGKMVETVDGQRRAAEALLEAGAMAALVKGGHVPGDVIIDVLQTQHGEWLFEHARIETSSTHGTGCTLASAIAAQVAFGHGLDEAIRSAGDYLQKAIAAAKPLGAGRGPVNHAWRFQGKT
ncbi:MAG: bifunctional hydroxymethylpyrimidine kinase/phosphomethylpyrimidine kinase [Pseudomonadota bacterium]